MQNLLFLLLIYMLCAIPFGLIITKLIADKDLRKFGSGSTGATNALRVGGKICGLLTLLLDGIKGVLAAYSINILVYNDSPIMQALGGLAMTLGHIYPPYLKFKGGRGVVVAMMFILFFNYKIFIVGTISWACIIYFTKLSSVASLVSLLMISSTEILFYKTIVTLPIFLVILHAHRSNIYRLLNGQEKPVV